MLSKWLFLVPEWGKLFISGDFRGKPRRDAAGSSIWQTMALEFMIFRSVMTHYTFISKSLCPFWRVINKNEYNSAEGAWLKTITPLFWTHFYHETEDQGSLFYPGPFQQAGSQRPLHPPAAGSCKNNRVLELIILPRTTDSFGPCFWNYGQMMASLL